MPWPAPAADGAPQHPRRTCSTVRAGRADRPPLLLGPRRLRALRLPLLRRARARARGAHRPRGQPGEGDDGRRRRRPARSPLRPRGRASVAGVGNAVHAALEGSARRAGRRPRRGAGDAPGARGAGRATARPGSASRRWSRAGSAPSFARSSTAGGRASGPRCRSCSGWGRGRAREDRSAGRAAPRAPGRRLQDRRPAGLRPGRARGPLRTQRDLYALAATARAERGGGDVRAAYCFLEAPGAARRSRPTTRPARGGARAPGGARRADPRRRLRAHRRALTPRSATAARRRRGSARSPPGGRSGPPRVPAGRGHERLAWPCSATARSSAGERGANPGPARGSAGPARLAGWRRRWSRRATTCAPRRPSPSPTADSPLLPRPQRRAAPRAGAQRRPDRADRGGARPPRRARDPLRPGRGHRRDRDRGAAGLRPRRHLHRQADPLRPEPPPGAVILASYAARRRGGVRVARPGPAGALPRHHRPPPGRGRRGACWSATGSRAGNPRASGSARAQLAFQRCAQARARGSPARSALPFSVSA